jgi:5-methyltetrahydropteroyltriglutamate--homocysteine methyltransferase
MTIIINSEANANTNEYIHIPIESVGSLPWPDKLIEVQEQYCQGKIDINDLNLSRIKAVQSTIEKFEATGSPVITHGEQTKSSFLNYPIETLVDE